MPPDTELRERKKLATYRALATAARELTMEHGLDAVTVDDIARAADVSPRTFFNYFCSKEEAIVGVEPTLLAESGAELEARPADESPLTALAAVLFSGDVDTHDLARRWVLRAELVRRYPSLLPRHLASLVEVERVLVAAMAARLGVDPADDPYPRTVVVAAVAVARTVMEWWHEHQPPVSLSDALQRAFDDLAAGLPAPSVSGGRRS